jgi:hypothetical protein
MLTIGEEPELMKARTVKVCTKTEIFKLCRPKNLALRLNFQKN